MNPITTNRQEQTMPTNTARAVAQAVERSPDAFGVDKLADELLHAEDQVDIWINRLAAEFPGFRVVVQWGQSGDGADRFGSHWCHVFRSDPYLAASQGGPSLSECCNTVAAKLRSQIRTVEEADEFAKWKAHRNALRKATDEMTAPLVEKYADNGEAVAGTLPLANGEDAKEIRS